MSEVMLPGSTVDLQENSDSKTSSRPQSAKSQPIDDATYTIPTLKQFSKSRLDSPRGRQKKNKVAPVDERPGTAPEAYSEGPKLVQRPMTALASTSLERSARMQTPLEVPQESALSQPDNKSLESLENIKKSSTSLRSDESRDGLKLKEDFNETAYIPYEYAHSMISRIVDDMKDMKMTHLSIVGKIENQYQIIESETQDQFQHFTQEMQSKYQARISQFRQVIAVLKARLLTSSNDNLDTIQSLKQKNKALLLEKAALLKSHHEQLKGIPVPIPLLTKDAGISQSDTESLKGAEAMLETTEEKIIGDLYEKEKTVVIPEEDSHVVEPAASIPGDELYAVEVKPTPTVEGDAEIDVSEEPEPVLPTVVLPPVDQAEKPAEEVASDEDVDEVDNQDQETRDLEMEALMAVEVNVHDSQEFDEVDETAPSEAVTSAEGSPLKTKQVAAVAGAAGVAAGAAVASGERPKTASIKKKPDFEQQFQKSRAMLVQAKKENDKMSKEIKALQKQIKQGSAAPPTGGVDKDKKRMEKQIKDLEKKLAIEGKKLERDQKGANELKVTLDETTRDLNDVKKKLKLQELECVQLREAAGAGAIALQQVPELQSEVKQLSSQNKTLTENYNSERILRKKYYNMVEDMKGKIRVYCRVRPLSSTEKSNKNKGIVHAPDDYTVRVAQNQRDTKEFQFDQIFTETNSQEDVFEDTYSLVQSAVDGYNVCIFAYGQTGSGKTYTMIGDKNQSQPGIAPRAFIRIFELADKLRQKFAFKISCYMLELYNEKLIDLLNNTPQKAEQKLDIKKDNKGMVFIQGATIQEAESSDELFSIFSKGSDSRHIASTKMNDESSRSHLVIGIVMESTNLATGAVTRGKLSLVDLAGSERVGKTGATAMQLKEANSINKSLSALGDVISALSSDQQFIPYRNNKLTMLMQDSLGGNAKTLMFVNISPADYNSAESIISLTYASRVKLITNDASKNAESKEVARLKQMVAKLKAGESIDDLDA